MFGGPLLLGGRGPVELTGRDTGTDPLLEWVGLELAMAGLGFELETEPGGLAGDPPLLVWDPGLDPGAPSPEGGRAAKALPGPTLSVIIYIEATPPETRKTDFPNLFFSRS